MTKGPLCGFFEVSYRRPLLNLGDLISKYSEQFQVILSPSCALWIRVYMYFSFSILAGPLEPLRLGTASKSDVCFFAMGKKVGPTHVGGVSLATWLKP